MTYNTQSWPVLATMQALIAMLPGTNKDWIPSDCLPKPPCKSHKGHHEQPEQDHRGRVVGGWARAGFRGLAPGVGAVLAAAAGHARRGQRAGAAEPVKFYPVVVAAKAIPAGTRIAPDMLEVAKWQVALSGGFRRPTCSPARSCAPTSPWAIPSCRPCWRGMASLLQPGERALAVAVDEVSGGGNRILPGDFVDVFFMLDKSSEVQAGQARLLQSQLRVLAYGANSLDGPEEKSLLQQGAPAQPAKTAVLAVPVERVSELMLASRAGRLQLALRPLGDAGVRYRPVSAARRAAYRRAPT